MALDPVEPDHLTRVPVRQRRAASTARTPVAAHAERQATRPVPVALEAVDLTSSYRLGRGTSRSTPSAASRSSSAAARSRRWSARAARARPRWRACWPARNAARAAQILLDGAADRPRRAARLPRLQGSGPDGLPGPVRLAQPAAHGPLPPRARAAPARGAQRPRPRPRRARQAARAGPPHPARAVPRRLPARALGRTAPARRDRAGARRRAAACCSPTSRCRCSTSRSGSRCST